MPRRLPPSSPHAREERRGYGVWWRLVLGTWILALLANPPLCGEGFTLAQAKEAQVTVRISTRDGVTLAGSYYPPAHGPVPAVLLLHMLARDRTDWNPLAAKFQAAGWAVLSLDLRGHGGSHLQGGKTVHWRDFSDADFNKMVLDVEAAQEHLKGLKEVDPGKMAIVGASIGCNIALNFASDHPQVRALILLSPGLEYRGVLSEPAMKRYGASRRPALIVSSTDDPYSADSSKRLKALAEARASLILYQRAGHGTRMLTQEKDLEGRIVSWLKTNLR